MKTSNIINNKKVSFDYDIKESFVGGLKLDGWMVKSIRAGKVSAADGSYIFPKNGELWLSGIHLTPLENNKNETQTTTIKVLMKKKEIDYLTGKVSQNGFTLVMKNLFWQKGMVKIEICLAKGNKKEDKRQIIKEKEMKKEAAREMKRSIK